MSRINKGEGKSVCVVGTVTFLGKRPSQLVEKQMGVVDDNTGRNSLLCSLVPHVLFLSVLFCMDILEG